jgi:putative ABC transport system ATP-binding protein
MNKSSFVDVRSISKTYHRNGTSVEVLRDVSFQVRPGEAVAVTGPSGCGKTTLLNLLAALDRPDRGEITVGDTVVTKLHTWDGARYRNRQIGVIFQSYNLFPRLTALENVLLPMIAAGSPDPKHAAGLLVTVGLGDRTSHRPTQLSGGEQQRVAIARALVNDPPLVLADEPTGNLDDENARAVLDLLTQACLERGKTLILVAHDLSALHKVDRVLELRAGSLRAHPISS